MARFHLGEQIDRVGGDADQKRRAGLDEAIDEARAARQIMDHDLPAHRKRHDHGAEAEIVAERAERIDDGLVVDGPVVRQRARVRQQRVVAMHHAFRLAGRARREGEIDNAIGIWRRGFDRCRGRRGHDARTATRRARFESIDVAQRIDRG